MAFEIKIKEVNQKEVFPALYSTLNRESVILVHREINGKLEGTVMLPKQSFGQYSMSWSIDKYKRMDNGSELTLKFVQE